MNNRINQFIFTALTGILFAACQPQQQSGNKDQAADAETQKDTLQIWADSSLHIIVNEQKKAFENIYNTPFLSISYKNEADIIEALMANRISCAVLQRTLLENESSYLHKKEEYLPKQYTFAYAAFVAVTHVKNPASAFKLSDAEAYFNGRPVFGFRLTVENERSQSVQFLRTKFSLSNEQISKTYANSSLGDMLDYLRSNPEAVGIMPFTYISDIDAPATVEMLRELKVLPVTFRDSAKKMRTVIPSQETISTREYPMISPLVLVNAGMPVKSGTNFVNYLFKTQAQRLILKNGLCPVVFPGREIIINTN